MFSRFHKCSFAVLVGALSYIPFGVVQTAAGSVAVPESPFAAVPLNLQETTVITSGNRPKSNMMLFIDDSNSMKQVLTSKALPSDGETSRMEVTTNVLLKLMDKYQEDFNWYLYLMCYDRQCSIEDTLNKVKTGSNTTPMTSTQMVSIINTLNSRILDNNQHGFYTPTTRQYANAVQHLMNAQEYRCQKSYIVVMSDGETTRLTNIVPNGNNSINFFNTANENYFMTDNYWTNNTDTRYPIGGYDWTTGDYSDNPLSSTYRAYTQYDVIEDKLKDNTGANYLSNGKLNLDKWNSGLATTGAYSHGMSFLSETLRTKDFKTSGTDVEGFDWDDPGEDSENPIDKQTITTFTIGLGVAFSGDPDFLDGCYYLRNGASPSPSLEQPVGAEVVNDSNYACPSDPKGRYFFTALDEDALFNAFDSAMATALEETVSTGGKETISTSTPATAGTQIPELSAYFSLDTNIWASVLYFNAISSNGEIDTSEQKTADPYGSTGNKKRIIVNKGDGTNEWIYATRYTPAFYGVNTQAEIQLGLIPWLRRDASDNDAAIEANVAASVDAAKRTVPEYRVRTSGSEDPQADDGRRDRLSNDCNSGFARQQQVHRHCRERRSGAHLPENGE